MATKKNRRYSPKTAHAPGRERKGVLVYFSPEHLTELKRLASADLRPLAAYVRLAVLQRAGLVEDGR